MTQYVGNDPEVPLSNMAQYVKNDPEAALSNTT